MEDPQLSLSLMGRLDGPAIVLPHVMKTVQSYRDAVKRCWGLRRRRNLTQRGLAEEVGLYAAHVTWYLNDGKRQLDLPGTYVRAFEAACGNTCITQFLATQARLTVTQVIEAAARELEMRSAA